MEDETGIKEVAAGKEDKTGKEEIFTKVVRAGKRTYFFDVKATRRDDYYLTITESKKRLGKEGKIFYEKHKIFLYKEDFEKFTEGLKNAVEYINDDRHIPIQYSSSASAASASDTEPIPEKTEFGTREFTNVDFDDLGKK
jgi:Protein of unknown function (DUF3276)